MARMIKVAAQIILLFGLLVVPFSGPAKAQSPTQTPTNDPAVKATITPNPAFTPTLTPFSRNQVWSTALQLSPKSSGSAWFPDIAADSTGQLHVTWSGGTVGFDTVLYTSSQDGWTWLEPNDILAFAQVNAGSAATRPVMNVNRDGYLAIIARNDSHSFFSQAPVLKAADPFAWNEPAVISGEQVTYFSKIVSDKTGVLHIFYTQNVMTPGCLQCYHLFHRESKDSAATWSPAQDISIAEIGTAKPQAVIDGAGNIHVVWEQGAGGGLGHVSDNVRIFYAASYDSGVSWSEPIALSPEILDNAYNATIGLDANGSLITAWLAVPENVVNYQVSTDAGKTWTVPIPIPGVFGGWRLYQTALDDYSMLTDSKGDVHLILVGQINSGSDVLGVLHLIWNGTNWSRPEAVVHMTGDVPEWPRAVISGGNVLNVVWFRRDKANIYKSDSAHYTVWYSRSNLSLPADPTIIPTYLPTLTPTPGSAIQQSLTEAIALESAPTPLPSQMQVEPTDITETDYVGLFMKAVLPAILFLIIVAVVVVIRRR